MAYVEFGAMDMDLFPNTLGRKFSFCTSGSSDTFVNIYGPDSVDLNSISFLLDDDCLTILS